MKNNNEKVNKKAKFPDYSMKKRWVIFIFIVSLAVLTSCKSENAVFIGNGKEKIKVNAEIADSPEERAAGLMFRKFLDEDSGMLFIFDDEKTRSFWMKNTLIPLDIIFISRDFEIVDIKYAVPCKEDPCVIYISKNPAKYVLEVNSNFTIKNGIAMGDAISVD